MNSNKDTYEAGLDDALTALRALHYEAGIALEAMILTDGHDPRERAKALGRIEGLREAHQIVTGLLLKRATGSAA